MVVAFLFTTYGTGFIFNRKSKISVFFYTYLSCRDGTVSSKIMKFGLSKSIFYVKKTWDSLKKNHWRISI